MDLKLREYNQLINNSYNTLFDRKTKKNFNNQLLDYVSDFISSLNESDINNITTDLNSLSLNRVSFLVKIYSFLSNRMFYSLNILWENSLLLGTRHIFYDILADLDPFKNIFNFNLKSFGYINEGIASFAKKKSDKNWSDAKKIGNAKRSLKALNRVQSDGGKLYENVLEQMGVYDSTTSESKTIKLTIEQKVKFLEAIQEINNTANKAELSRKNFLGDFYLRQRIRVLSNDYAKKYNDNIKKDIAKYLNENREGLNQLRRTTRDVRDLKEKIKFNLSSGSYFDRSEYDSRAKMIMRTEIGLAYNFGKLSGFTAPEDIERYVQWQADWELERRTPSYEICSYCLEQDGKIFRLRDVLVMGATLDTGILKYNGNNRTQFKNPSLPVILYHPNCMCHYKILPLDFKPKGREKKEIFSLSKTLKDQAATIVGAGLIVGGAFLLSRSNLFKTFIKASYKQAGKIISNGLKSLDDSYALNKQINKYTPQVTYPRSVTSTQFPMVYSKPRLSTTDSPVSVTVPVNIPIVKPRPKYNLNTTTEAVVSNIPKAGVSTSKPDLSIDYPVIKPRPSASVYDTSVPSVDVSSTVANIENVEKVLDQYAADPQIKKIYAKAVEKVFTI